jgi:polyvinyl alcohol dehydrogenase (cytochrome)
MPIEASAIVTGGVVYFGSWDGYEYALDATTGTLKWKTFIDTTTTPAGCNAPWPVTQGVSSSATVNNGVLYVGGGGQYWYALDASNGSILWKVFTGDNGSGAGGGYYNWASPVLFDGYAYVATASAGNCPSVQGQLLQVDLGTHQVIHTFDVVPSGQQGGAIWSSPAVDPATSTVYLSTGTPVGSQTDQPYTVAILALDATTLSCKASWQIPVTDNQGDSDFGASPTLFTDQSGRALVGAANKNGIFYALDRSNLAAGPVWKFNLAQGGFDPPAGDGSIAAAAFPGGSTLYAAGGNTTVRGTAYSGSIRALDTRTGAVVWEQGTAGTVMGAVVYTNGLLVDAAGKVLEVRQASDGQLLFSATIETSSDGSFGLSASPTVANGIIYEGTPSGTMYAFGL